MNVRARLRERAAGALAGLVSAEEVASLAELVVPAHDPRFGDYQANCAMPLAKQLRRPPRDVAAELVARLAVDDLCQPAEIAGAGFINLRLRDEFLTAALRAAMADERLGIEPGARPRTIVIDFSGPNVAKPMHVGHIRSTVIGDSLCRTLRFLGHTVISDNHLGDWGTQFGMILFGYKHFLDAEAYRARPVDELARLYRTVNQLVDYHESTATVAELTERVAAGEADLARQRALAPAADPAAAKKQAQALKRAEAAQAAAVEELAALRSKRAALEADPEQARRLAAYPTIARDVLEETARLHAGDPENLRLWHEFMGPCQEALDATYRRLGVTFDETLGESFYRDQLAAVVADLEARGLARESDGALCVFLEGHAAPMLVRKQDGAYLYATTDLATLRYRLGRWRPDAILYVVDHRQSLHFEQLFATARLWGLRDVELTHVSFGTVLGQDGRPFKTRAGDTVGLSSLLDEAVERAHRIVSENDDADPAGPSLSAERRREIAEAVGLAALKYADLSQNRTSDYVFSYDKMLAMNGNTATYMQYAYARVRSTFRKGQIDVEALRAAPPPITLQEPAERALGLELLRFAEALEQTAADYRPNHLTAYLYELANRYSSFYDQCPVLKAPTAELRASRLALCDLTARTLRQGLELLGIRVVEQM